MDPTSGRIGVDSIKLVPFTAIDEADLRRSGEAPCAYRMAA